MNKLLKSTFLLPILICIIWLGCSAGDGDENNDNTTNTETVFRISTTANEDGEASASFSVISGTTKLSVSATADDGRFVRFTQIQSGNGTNYLNPGRESISLSQKFSAFVNTASIPSRSADNAVVDSQPFVVTAEVADDELGRTPSAGEQVDFDVISKSDPNLESGTMRVNLFYVGDLGAEASTKEIVEAAVEEFKAIYSNSASISVNVSSFDIRGPVNLPLPLSGDSFYRSASLSAPSPSVNVFIGGDIAELEGSVLGIAANIPGCPSPSERSGVAVSIFNGAGPDGVYSNEEVRILGETIAHEAGHYMGLFHPIDFSGNTVSNLDPLADTATCSFSTECVGIDSLIENLMYPTPVQDVSGGFIPQNKLTANQRSVMNRYIVVD